LHKNVKIFRPHQAKTKCLFWTRVKWEDNQATKEMVEVLVIIEERNANKDFRTESKELFFYFFSICLFLFHKDF
jgi:hypothetical protein